MSTDQLVVAVAAATLVCGVMLVWSGWRATPTRPATRDHAPRSLQPVAGGVGAAAATYAVSGWVLPAGVIGIATATVIDRLAQRTTHHDSPERVEALAAWVENVRDVLQAAGQPIGAIGVTVDSADPLIRPAVQRLHARLGAGRSPEWAMRTFADELDDPLADLVAIGLLVAITRGAQTEQVLSALATQARHHADRRRIVEAERAPMRHQVIMVSAIMCVLLGGVFVFARSKYLDAYDTANGQVVLAIVLFGYVALVARVVSLSRFPRPARFLTARGQR